MTYDEEQYLHVLRTNPVVAHTLAYGGSLKEVIVNLDKAYNHLLGEITRRPISPIIKLSPEECDCCSSETSRLTFYEGCGTLQTDRWLCEFCEATIAGSRYEFLGQLTEYDRVVIDIARMLNVLQKTRS